MKEMAAVLTLENSFENALKTIAAYDFQYHSCPSKPLKLDCLDAHITLDVISWLDPP